MDFLYFLDENNNKTNIAFCPGYYFDENLDDLVIKLEIIDYKIIFKVVKNPWMAKSYEKEINNYLKKSNFDGWEYFTFYNNEKLEGEDNLIIYAEEHSSIYKILNSSQNIENIENNTKRINKL